MVRRSHFTPYQNDVVLITSKMTSFSKLYMTYIRIFLKTLKSFHSLMRHLSLSWSLLFFPQIPPRRPRLSHLSLTPTNSKKTQKYGMELLFMCGLCNFLVLPFDGSLCFFFLPLFFIYINFFPVCI
jgi:hypothetical protein